ncbi:GNAT family N-acetyltransferase [Microbacterium cremeum]|uniref:GNAT family N-acetyltransferase n=1 Tax=Microbacterium cremeum TaxID=2782169 RepID=UPI001887F5AD|nr:GNAT family N-acetyltransferase [Microbacterium cremeum]
MKDLPFSIRVPVIGDATAIADLHVATWREAYAHLLAADHFSDEYIAGRRKMWINVLSNAGDDVTIHIAERDSAIIGFAWAGPAVATADEGQPPRRRQLYAIYVAAAHYGTGAGQALLDQALASEPAMLWVAKENPRAIAFYRRNGFRFDGVEQTDPYAPRITDARMVR